MLNIADVDICFQFENLKIRLIKISYGVFYKPFPKHRHGNRFYEAHLVCSGNGTLIAEGKEYPLNAGSLYMTGPLVTHEQLTDPSNPMDEFFLQFEITERKNSAKSKASEILKNTSFWIGTDSQNMLQIFEQLTREDQKKEICYVDNIINLTSQLLIALIRNYSGVEKSEVVAKATPNDKRMVITDESFLDHYATLTLDELCKRLNLSRRQTQRFLQKTYGKNFIDLRKEARLNKASDLIRQGLSPSEAAVKVGYESEQSLKILFQNSNRE